MRDKLCQQAHEKAHATGDERDGEHRRKRCLNEALAAEIFEVDRSESSSRTDPKADQSDRAEEVHRFLEKPVKETQNHQVEDHFHEALEAIVRLAVKTR